MTDFHRNTMMPTEEAPCAVESPEPRYPGDDLPGDPSLLRKGWQRRFMADGARLHEYADLYQALGFEVHTEPVTQDELGEECGDCRLMICRLFVTVYTRRSATPTGDGPVGSPAGRRND